MSGSTPREGSDRRPGEFGPQVGSQLGPRFGSRASRLGPVSKPKDIGAVLAHLWVYLRQQRRTLALVFAATLVSSLVSIFGPRLIGTAIDPYVLDGDLLGLSRILILLSAMYASSSLASWVQQTCMVGLSNRALREMRHDLFAKVQALPLSFFDSATHGDLMSRLANDVDTVGMALGQPIVQLFSSVVSISGTLIIMFSMSVWMALTVLAMVPVTLLVTTKVAGWSRKLYRRRQEALGEINGYIEEMVTGARVVKVFGREDDACAAFNDKSERLRDIAYRTELVSGMFMPAMHLLDNLSFAVVALIGALLAANGIIHLGIVASFIIYSRQFMQPVRDLSNQWNTFQSGLAGAERVFEIMDTESEADAPGANDLRLPVSGHVEFERVSFGYKPGVPVLTDISLEAKPGQTIALVGATGSGKTTIISLLSRFYDIEEGHIYVDGVDVREIRRESLRRALGIVLQDSQLFSGTVRENIRYGRPDASDADVEKAAELALADPFIRRMPEGYDSVLTADGGNLGHGQRQLLCIARAVLADPAILILDEATSSVDTRTELRIQQAILRLMRGRTSFVIAHRLSTIQGADQILVIDHGRIVERGAHDELLARGGAYARLHESQFHVAAQPAMGHGIFESV
mgnify:CR=1 FL=1